MFAQNKLLLVRSISGTSGDAPGGQIKWLDFGMIPVQFKSHGLYLTHLLNVRFCYIYYEILERISFPHRDMLPMSCV